ncbi:MAG: fructosamine kinase family protein, partial [Pseudomonadota bacterium]
MQTARVAAWLSLPASDVRTVRRVGGGDTAAAYQIQTREGARFIKTLPAAAHATLAAEARGLAELHTADALRVPRVLACGCDQALSWLVLEWLEMRSSSTASAAQLGVGLALLHRTTAASFGFEVHNFIGRSPQTNTPTSRWDTFFATHRLGTQRT